MMRMAGFTVALMVITAIFATCIDGNEFSGHREIKILSHLKRLNKHALKSIKSEDGDVIDCVPITNQPAFDHPLLKNHTIQMRPSFNPRSDSTDTKKEAKAITQYAVMGVRNGKFYGTQVAINLWKPYVQNPKEFNLAQTWVVSGSGSSLNTIEAGWQVYPELYDDNNPRFFVYWTRDGYQKTGCYNLLCSGFVQTSNRYTVGGSITTVSRYRGTQYDLSILIWKDQKTGNWWLRINEKYVIGYWPSSLFTTLGREATRVEWGGEIINYRTGARHGYGKWTFCRPRV